MGSNYRTKEQIWEDEIWGIHLKNKEYYKKMTPKNLTKEEWEKQIDFIFDDYKEKKSKMLPCSERICTLKLGRIFYGIAINKKK